MLANIRFLRACLRAGVPAIMENPATSKCWYLPELEEIAASHQANTLVIDQCMYGQPWRKRTKLLCLNFDAQDLCIVERRCAGQHGLCSRTGLKHHILSGGMHATRAAAFPKQLCKALARLLTNPARMAYADTQSAMLCRVPRREHKSGS